MAVIYGWSYADFNTAIGWDKAEAAYLLWENFWAHKIEAYVFVSTGTSPRFTDANEKIEIATIVNDIMVQMNIYLKAESVESPMETGFFTGPGFPIFHGDPEGLGTEHYRILNKYRRKYSELKVASIRLGVVPDNDPFPQERLYR